MNLVELSLTPTVEFVTDYRNKIVVGNYPLDCVRITCSGRYGQNLSHTTVNVYDPEGRKDFEGDSCHLVRFEVYNPSDADLSWFPSVQFAGHVRELRVSDDICPDPDGMGLSYLPEPIEWVPGLYVVSLMIRKEQ